MPANTYFAVWSSDTGDGGDDVAAYTFQFGNGFSATLAAEDPRRERREHLGHRRRRQPVHGRRHSGSSDMAR